jgi:hypothetical protein
MIIDHSEFTPQILQFPPLKIPSTKSNFTRSLPPILGQFFAEIHAELIDILPLNETFQKVANEIQAAPTAVLPYLSDQQKISTIFNEILANIPTKATPATTAHNKQLS